MSILEELSFGFRRKLPVTLQTEAAECGLACLAMISIYHGHRIDLATLRRRHSVSLKGTTLTSLIQIAETLDLSARPLRLELEELGHLRLPCILHWDMDHFVVLREVRRSSVVIHDPACGVRVISLEELSSRCTGVALELWPNPGFTAKQQMREVNLRDLIGRSPGLYRSMLQAFVLAVALEIFVLVSPFLLQWVVDEALVSSDRDLLTTLVLGFGLLLVAQVLISTTRSWILMFMSTSLNVQWSGNVFAHLLRLPLPYFQKRHLGDINSRFGSINQIQDSLTTAFIAGVLDGLMSLATLIMMYIYSPMLAMVAVTTMTLYAISRWLSYRMLMLATNSQIVFAAKQSSHFLESVRSVKALKLFQREDLRRTTWLSLLVDQINANLRTQKLMITYGSINTFLIGIENLLIVWLGGRMVLDGMFSVGMLLAFKAYKDQFDGRVSSLIDKLFQFRLLKLQGARLADIVLTPPEHSTSPLEQQALEGRPTDITLSGLRFRYGEHDPFVLNGVDLRIAAGESVAIVGPSGCGKTTLMHVILGVLEPSAGEVAIGGASVRRLGAATVRGLIGSVTQDDTLLAGSISDNISFFDPTADQAWIEECARIASIHEEIVAMPMGYNSLVGDMGSVLSGGQKQRVLLARAIYKRPKILFLDEATSHLDIDRERQVNAAISALSITRIVIAHRPDTIASANRVVRMVGGIVVADYKNPTTQQDEMPAPSHGNERDRPQLPGLNALASLPAAPGLLRIGQ